ncbi:GDSL-type esterase/lipase family protein, partial [Pseudoflavonifractor sp. An85]|uniref:GDSL-type esterase/lipase family protein n=1 Tax=Pseudoflavonifractor sp. An85 TaxID=1965661 RepID=UPI000B584090
PSEGPITPYTFGSYVEESDPVEDSWFETAAFIGDSRTEGLKAYSGLQYGDFFFSRGMNVFRVDDEDYKVVSIDGKDYTILEALALKKYQSVYIMMGINELGYPLESYRSGLSKLLERVLEIQPNAVIYLQTLPPVNEETAKKNSLNDSINNTNVAAFNKVIVELATKYKVALVDTGAAYRDENGSLPADLASDGVHFTPGAYRRWVDYMASHTMSFQRFDQSRKEGSTPQRSEEVHET